MNIRISKRSEITVRNQLVEQIVSLIAAGTLRPGDVLPSVRGLASRLKINRNTVSQAYQDLVSRNWLARKRGSRMVVISSEQLAPLPRTKTMDDLINATIQAAQEHGYTLQQLRQRVQERLLAQPPDHLLVVEQEPGLRRLLQEELKEKLAFPVRACSRSELSSNRGLAIGALVVTTQGARQDISSLVPKDRPIFKIAFSAAEELAEAIRKLREPSIIAVVSVSERLLEAARGLLAPAVARHHTLREFVPPLESSNVLRAADVVFCDSISRRSLKARNVVHYRLISKESLKYLARAVRR
jgi:GntR family transcriptional regulator